MFVTIPVEITNEQMENLLVTAFEGGSGYWMYIKSIKYPPGKERKDYGDFPVYEVPFVKNGAVIIGDNETEETWTLTLLKMKKGLRIMAKKYPHHFKDVLMEDGDADTGDVFLQCSLFGELVYG